MSQERDAAALERFRPELRRNESWRITLPDSLDEDVEVHQAAELLGTKGTFRGKDGVIELLDEIAEAFTEIDWRPQRVIDPAMSVTSCCSAPKERGAEAASSSRLR